jgi:hypothetical protein
MRDIGGPGVVGDEGVPFMAAAVKCVETGRVASESDKRLMKLLASA